jgi:hypothetical protein
MTQLAHSAPKINWDDLTQVPAQPLGSWLKTDPWDDRVHQLNTKVFAPMNPRDKMPLEVTPIYFRLQRYSGTDTAQPAADPNGAPTPAQNAPAPAPGQGQQAAPAADGGQQQAAPPATAPPATAPAPAPQAQ